MPFNFKLYLFLIKHLLFNIILFNIFYVIYSNSEVCDIDFFPELNYPKVVTLSNNYKLMLTTTGIYSFIPTLNRIAYSYNFTNEQKIESEEQREIYRAQISQFSNETGGNEYVLCYLNNFIYVLNDHGHILFSEQLNLTLDNLDSFSLICYDYNSIYNYYTFFIIQNTDNIECQGNRILFIYSYSLKFISEDEGTIIMQNKFSHFPSKYIDYNYSISSGGISCNNMIRGSSKIINCFIPISTNYEYQKLLALGINPNTNEFSNNGFLQEYEISFISSSVGNDKSKALVCFLNLREKGLCYSYNINNQNFSSTKILELNCTSENYILKTFYFSDSNEFVFSCLRKTPMYLMRRINSNFDPINSDFYESNFNCAFLLSHSIVYVRRYRAYVAIIHSSCIGGMGIRFFELTDSCKMKNATETILEGDGEEKEENKLTQQLSDVINFSSNSLEYKPSSYEDYLNTDKNIISSLIESDRKHLLTDLKLKDKTESYIKISSDLINYETNEFSSGITERTEKIGSTDNKDKLTDILTVSKKLSDINIKTDEIKELNSDSNEGTIKLSLSDRNTEKQNSDFNIESTKLLESDSNTQKIKLHSDIITEYNKEFSHSETNEKKTYQLESSTNIEYYTDSKTDYISPIINEEITNAYIHTESLTQSYIEDSKNIKSKTYAIDLTYESLKEPDKCICHKDFPYLLFPSLECTNSCDVSQLLNKTCKVDCISDETFQGLVHNIKALIKNDSFNDKEEIVIVGNNVICDITTTQMKRKYNNISYIDFGACEEKLKQKHKINYLLILKFDIKLDDNSPTSVEYEVYNPYTKEKLDLSICSNEKINIEVPKLLDDYSFTLYQNLSSYGYDVFNKNDPFYNEICTVYSSEDKTDVLLIDRRISYYNESLLFCENGCEYSNYNIDRQTVTCKCEVKKNVSTDINEIGFEKNNLSGFFDVKTYMNIGVIRCYNLLFSKNGFINNYGSYILSFEILMFLIIMILFYFKFKQNIISLIFQVYPKYNYNKLSSPPKKNNIINKNTNKNNSKENLIYKREKLKIKKQKKENIKIKDNKNEKEKDKKNNEKKKNSKRNNKKNKNKENLNKFNYKEKKEYSKDQNLDSSHKKIKDLIFDRSNKNTVKFPENDIKIYKRNKNIKKLLNLNDEEINTLEYKDAIIIDKRTFCQYYVSLIKKRNVILFTFIPQNDYNLIKIKICLFIISFSLYFTINSLFFTDKTMRKIYKEKGKYNIISQLPKIFYSSLITTAISIILKALALSEKNIISLKKFKDKNKDKKKKDQSIKEVYHRLKIKFNIFFVISIIFLLLFWYYVSVFCCVYINTQIILIEDTILNFGITLIYPLVVHLLTSWLRITSLKSGNLPGIYIFSKIIRRSKINTGNMIFYKRTQERKKFFNKNSFIV